VSSNLRCDSVHYPVSGNYRAQLVVTDSVSCNLADTAYVDVNVKITPVAGFVDLDSVNVIFPVQFENTSANGTIYQWDFGDGDSSFLHEPNHTYTDSGYYNVCMAVFQDECFDTVCHDIKVFRLDQTVWIPAAFTPNGDGRNDYFFIDGLGIASLKMVIVNRWGELVFESNTVDARWDGTVKGSPAISGVYSVRIEAAFFDGASTKQYGSVTLYR
jgi:gliding motility-associated-like protein